MGSSIVKDATGFVVFLDRIIADTLTDGRLLEHHVTKRARYVITTQPLAFCLLRYPEFTGRTGVLCSKMKVSKLLDPAMKAHKSAIERHHLFPKGHQAKLSIKELRYTNQIAN
jgi:hypothetical protein